MTYAQQVKLEKLRFEVKKAYLEWQNATGKEAGKLVKKWLSANAKLDKYVQRLEI